MTLLREGLLEGRTVVLAGEVPNAVAERLGSLGAKLHTWEPMDEERGLGWTRDLAPVNALVCATSSLASVDNAWVVVRAIANGALIPATAGAIVLLAPAPAAADHAEAVRAGLENLARTLSVEWARYGITTTAIAPGKSTNADDLATLVAFLCSAAGSYFSGCRFELDPIR
jgi:hypothetical protein